MLRRISQGIDRLKCKRLFVTEEFNISVAQPSTNAGVETYRFLHTSMANPASAIKDRSLQKHLKRMVELVPDSGRKDVAR
jgi:hypothetical protein